MGNCCCVAKQQEAVLPRSAVRDRPPPPIPSESDPRPNDVVLLRALYDYQSQSEGDVSFAKGDFLELVEKVSEQWWIARNPKTGTEGYVPVNYLRTEDDTPQSHDCFFDMQRRDAERMLLAPGSGLGQFIVRPATKPNCLALSVRDQDAVRGVAKVKHYLIRSLDNGRGYFISAQHQFQLFNELIEHYKHVSEGLCRRLTEPVPRVYTPPTFREFEVDRRCVQFGLRLGAGCFGEVYAAKFNDVIDVAVKTLKPGTMSTEKFIREAHTMHQLHHPKIVQLLGVCTKAEPVYIITELMPNGALLNYLQNHATSRDISFTDQMDMAAQISDGMEYLEERRLVHRDLRTANILVGENNEVKVADFGLTTLLEDDVYTPDENAKFPVRWTAPEAMSQRQFSIKSDVWSFGILLYELVTYGRQPYPGMSNREVMEFVQAGQVMRNPRSETAGVSCPDELFDGVMRNCWKYEADLRPTFAFLHKTLDDFDAEALRQYDEQPVGKAPPPAPAAAAPRQQSQRAAAKGPKEVPPQAAPAWQDPEPSSQSPSSRSNPKPNKVAQLWPPQKQAEGSQDDVQVTRKPNPVRSNSSSNSQNQGVTRPAIAPKPASPPAIATQAGPSSRQYPNNAYSRR